ncbi:MAG: NUDIX hydrolase [Candidatus Cloacimonetes bacterium]|nr:NUDIX hydrolase [Candidatus Cloacimonadota bacterium]
MISKDSTSKKNSFCLRCGHSLQEFIDEGNQNRLKCAKCGWILYRNPVPASACVILNTKSELLIIRRKFPPQPGEWALPSGYIEINNDPEETAVIEMKEETGLDGEVERFLGYFPDYSPIYEKVISFGFLMKIKGGKLMAGDDASEAKFVNAHEMPPIAFKSHRYFIEKVRQLLENPEQS